jgi:hypothetical protein
VFRSLEERPLAFRRGDSVRWLGSALLPCQSRVVKRNDAILPGLATAALPRSIGLPLCPDFHGFKFSTRFATVFSTVLKRAAHIAMGSRPDRAFPRTPNVSNQLSLVLAGKVAVMLVPNALESIVNSP